MSKRNCSYFLPDHHQQTYTDKQKYEQMCENKLKKISRVKCNLIQKVLLRNMLKYVQNIDYVTFACDDGLEYEPLYKRQYKNTSSDHIHYILCKMTSLQPLLLPITDF